MTLIWSAWDVATSYLKDAVLLFLGTLGGALISLYFFRKGLTRKEISYSYDHDRLIWADRSFFGDIETFYHGTKVHDPRRVLYYVWNSGNQIIEGNSISGRDPFRISGENVTILVASLIKQSREAVFGQVNRSGDGRYLEITFDFLEPGDGLVVEVLYDTQSDKNRWANSVHLEGTIKGVRSIVPRLPLEFESDRWQALSSSAGAFLISVIAFILLIFQVFDIYETSNAILWVPKAMTALGLLVVVAVTAFAFFSSRSSGKVPRRLRFKSQPAKETGSRPLIERIEAENDRIKQETKLMIEGAM